MSATNGSTKLDIIYGIDDIPPKVECAALGLQHYLTMFGSTVAIPLMMAGPLGISEDPEKLGWLIGTMFFVSGIATMLQATWGNRLPIIQGGTFSFLAPAMAICGMAAIKDAGFEVKMTHIQGAVIVGGVMQMAVGYSGLVGKVLRFVGPVTIAPTIALIGLSLYPFGAPVAGKHWGIGGLTIALIILFSQLLRQKHRIFELFPILLGMGGAWAVAAILTATDVFPADHPAYCSLDKVAAAAWVRVPMPFQWGMPAFNVAAIIGLLAGVIASIVESIGDYYACARLAGAPIPTAKVVSKGIGMEGVGGIIAGVFGTGNGTTSYSENIGAIGLTRVGSRRVIQWGAGIMIILGTVAKFGALFTTIPQPIVGGMYCALFGMIAAVGLSNLQFVDMNAPRNLFIIGFAFFMGLSMPQYIGANPVVIDGMPWLADIINTLGKTSMAVGAFIALLLDNIVPGTDEERGLTAWAQPKTPSEEAYAPTVDVSAVNIPMETEHEE